ncbi:MAG: hypothetical protein JWR38_1068 [Mucilaginibacter sp.]|nr:hypothetical protein [Mucilaginibacter sp.]
MLNTVKYLLYNMYTICLFVNRSFVPQDDKLHYKSCTNSLYLHVANSDLHTYLKTRAKRCLLAFTFLVSFFALSGYVSHSLPNNNRVSDTEVSAVRPSVLKGGISYKRASLLFYKSRPSGFLINKNFTRGVLLFNKLTITKNRHLKLLFLFTKHAVSYPIDHLHYTADQDRDITSFQIG